MYLYFADSVTFKDIPPFIAVSGKDRATSNLKDNLHVHVLSHLVAIVCYFLTTGRELTFIQHFFLFLLKILIIPMIVRIAGWNVTLQ